MKIALSENDLLILKTAANLMWALGEHLEASTRRLPFDTHTIYYDFRPWQVGSGYQDAARWLDHCVMFEAQRQQADEQCRPLCGGACLAAPQAKRHPVRAQPRVSQPAPQAPDRNSPAATVAGAF